MLERYSRSGLALMFAPLYAGPIVAGWSAAPAVTLIIFSAVFFLIQLRVSRTETQNLIAQIVSLIFLALVQVGIVTLAFGIGLGLARMTAPLSLPVWFPLALTGCSAAIAALRYRHAQDDAAMLDLIDRTIDTLGTGADVDVEEQEHPGIRLKQVLESNTSINLTELKILVEKLISEDVPASALPPLETLIEKANQFPALAPLIVRMQQERDSKRATEIPTGETQ